MTGPSIRFTIFGCVLSVFMHESFELVGWICTASFGLDFNSHVIVSLFKCIISFALISVTVAVADGVADIFNFIKFFAKSSALPLLSELTLDERSDRVCDT